MHTVLIFKIKFCKTYWNSHFTISYMMPIIYFSLRKGTSFSRGATTTIYNTDIHELMGLGRGMVVVGIGEMGTHSKRNEFLTQLFAITTRMLLLASIVYLTIIIQACFILSSRVLLDSYSRRSSRKCNVKRFFKSTATSNILFALLHRDHSNSKSYSCPTTVIHFEFEGYQ